MKKLIGIMIVCMGIGCQKAELIDNPDGRNATEEMTDTVDVDVVPEGWGGSIDVGFGFG